MRSSQFDKASALITEFGKMDPANSKVKDFLGRIEGIKKLHSSIVVLEKESIGGKFTPDHALKLAELYRQIGQVGRHNALLASILKTPNLPPNIQFKVAQAYDRTKNYKEMNKVLDKCLKQIPKNSSGQPFLDIARLYAKARNGIGMKNALNQYLQRTPNDWRAWMDLASIEVQLKNIPAANAALSSAIRYGGPEARQAIQKNQMLNNLLKSRSSRTQNLMNIGL
jgi:tetratricopeptide (TPR) repeat protein